MVNRRLCLLVASLWLGLLVPARAFTTITVCASGCTWSNSNLQAALNAAGGGDTVLLQKGITYTGTFALRDNNQTSMITIRTGVDATGNVLSTSIYPDADIRLCPSDVTACAGEPGETAITDLATIKVQTNNAPALYTVSPGMTGNSACLTAPCVADYYTFKWVKFEANQYGGANIVELGSNRPDDGGTFIISGDLQDSTAEIPSNFILDQVYFAGHAVTGQHRCLAISARNVIVRNSYFKDCKTNQNDGQAIANYNTDGPLLIENNYIEASTEGYISGGDDIRCRPETTVAASPTATATVFTVALSLSGSPCGLQVGQWLDVNHSSQRYSGQVASISGNQITLTGALAITPSTGDLVRWSIIMKDLTFRKNHVIHPLYMRDPVVATPTGHSATGFTSGGSLAAGTYYLKIAARHEVNQSTMYESTPTSEITCTVASGSSGRCSVSWSAVTNVNTTYNGEYRVYVGTSTGAQDRYFTVTAPTVTYSYTGGAGTAGTPLDLGDRWAVKNLFEIKSCQFSCLVEGNIFENNWTDNQNGYSILFSTLNDGGDNPSGVASDITFRKNKILNVPGGWNISCTDTNGYLGTYSSGMSKNILIENNLVTGQAPGAAPTGFGDGLATLQTTGGEFPGFNTTTWCENIDFLHNTVIADTGINSFIRNDIVNLLDLSKKVKDFDVRNNIVSYGANGIVAFTSGTSGTSPFLNNGISNRSPGCTSVPSSGSNFCVTDYTGEFVGGGNYRLAGGSAWNNAGTDGLDLGADIDAIELLTDIAESGDNSGVVGTTSVPRIRLRIRGN